MTNSYGNCIILIFLCALLHRAHNLDYKDLEATGVACPKRDKCEGYRNNLNYTQRSCECDSACGTYKDCCIDARRRSSGQTVAHNNIECINFDDDLFSGVYAVSKCSSSWNGPDQVRQKCEDSLDLSDPLTSAPVFSSTQIITYKNMFCAKCNDADMESLKVFNFKLSCDSGNMPEEELISKLTYNQETKRWGINRLDARGKTDFKECEIHFDVPGFLNRNVRFCRANVISKCARDWTRHQVRKACEQYMAVVYDKTRAYKNPHCALCNHKAMSEVACTTDLLGKKKLFPLSALVKVNEEDNNRPTCPSKQLYDPYFKRCRPLACALPGYVLRNNKCVSGQ